MSIQTERFGEIADAIRSYTGETGGIAPNSFAEKIGDVFRAGQAQANEKQYEVVNTITTTEEQESVLINQDSNGNPLNLSDMIVQINYPSIISNTTFICTIGVLNDGALQYANPGKATYQFNAYNLTSNNTNANVLMGLIRHHNLNLLWINNPNSNTSNIKNYAHVFGSFFISNAPITSVNMTILNSGKYPAGTKFTLWGVKNV